LAQDASALSGPQPVVLGCCPARLPAATIHWQMESMLIAPVPDEAEESLGASDVGEPPPDSPGRFAVAALPAMLAERFEATGIRLPLPEGCDAPVSVVRDRKTRGTWVHKEVPTAGLPSSTRRMLLSEGAILQALDHEGIVKLQEAVEVEDNLHLILEHLQGDVLTALLARRGGRLPESLAAELLKQILEALAHCHARGVLHRDIHPGNVVLAESMIGRKPRCKLIDFGFAARASISDRSETAAFREVVGTTGYTAPEMLARRPAYDCKVDVWSAGAVGYEMMLGRPPCGREDEGSCADPQAKVERRVRHLAASADLEAELRKAAPEESPWDGLSKGAHDFLLRVLQADPKKRPSAGEASKHPWLLQARHASLAKTLGGC